MLTYIVIAFIAMAFLHFIYEGIIAPSNRLKIRLELFRMRDKLRFLKIQHGNELDDKHYHHLQDSLNTLIRCLSSFDLITLVRVIHEIERDKDVKARLEARMKILDDCAIQDARAIREQSLKLARRALRVNSGAWGFYIVPVAIAFACYEKIKDYAKQSISLPEPDLKKITPSTIAVGVSG